MTLKFSPKAHRYWCDKKNIQGVTTILKGGLPVDGLMYWSAKTVAEHVADFPEEVESLRGMGREPMVAALKNIPWQKRDEAAVRGTDVHAIAEAVINGEAVEVPGHLVDHVQGYVDWLDEFDVTPVLTEKSCANRTHWYAGRFDLIADFAGYRWMLDNKTSKSVYGSTALQLHAYANAEFYVEDDEPDVEIPMPEGIERYGVLHITDHGTFLYPVDHSQNPWRDFLNVLAVNNARKRIDGYLTEPITDPTEIRSNA